MSVAIETTPTFAAHTPKVLFEGPYLLGSPGAHSYDVSVDDQQFVMVQPGEQDESRPLEVILNWFDEVKRRVPAR